MVLIVKRSYLFFIIHYQFKLRKNKARQALTNTQAQRTTNMTGMNKNKVERRGKKDTKLNKSKNRRNSLHIDV